MIEATRADITRLDVDAIVNAANERLQHGGGVAAAIARAGGPSIQEESDEWVRSRGPLEPGVAAVTGAGEMPSRLVIHVAGPRFREGQDNEGLLRTAVNAALGTAAGEGVSTVALPAISAGIFGYPLSEATAVIADTARLWVDAHPGELERIILVGYDEEAAEAFRAALG
ncbi:MAG TPA: macro domain-containing protein [Acidimicrobiia bacterium]|nr:macro domain-containing protein [Acidimicrobiia bacterium]